MPDQRVVGLMALVFQLDKRLAGSSGELQCFAVVAEALDEDGDAAVVEQAEGVGAVGRDEAQLFGQPRTSDGVVVGAIPELIPERIIGLPRRAERVAHGEQSDNVGHRADAEHLKRRFDGLNLVVERVKRRIGGLDNRRSQTDVAADQLVELEHVRVVTARLLHHGHDNAWTGRDDDVANDVRDFFGAGRVAVRYAGLRHGKCLSE